MENKIYGYGRYKHYKYIIAHTLTPSRFLNHEYNAMDGYNSKIKAVCAAYINHLHDRLDWVVIENF